MVRATCFVELDPACETFADDPAVRCERDGVVQLTDPQLHRYGHARQAAAREREAESGSDEDCRPDTWVEREFAGIRVRVEQSRSRLLRTIAAPARDRRAQP